MIKDPMDLDIELSCNHCDYEENLSVSECDYIAWHNGKYIQDSFPFITAGQRDLMLSNTCDDCWQKFFPE